MSGALVLVDLDSVIHELHKDGPVGALGGLRDLLDAPASAPRSARVVVGMNTRELRRLSRWDVILEVRTALEARLGILTTPAELEVVVCLPVPQTVDTALVRLLRRTPCPVSEAYAFVHLISRDKGLRARVSDLLGCAPLRHRTVHHQWRIGPRARGAWHRIPSRDVTKPIESGPVLPVRWSVFVDSAAVCSAAWSRPIDLPAALHPSAASMAIESRPGLLSQVGATAASVRGVGRFLDWLNNLAPSIGPCLPTDGLELAPAAARPLRRAASPVSAATIGPGAVTVRDPPGTPATSPSVVTTESVVTTGATLFCRLPVALVKGWAGGLPLGAGGYAIDADRLIAGMPVGPALRCGRFGPFCWASLQASPDASSAQILVEAYTSGPPIWRYDRAASPICASEPRVPRAAALLPRPLRVEIGLYRMPGANPSLWICAAADGPVSVSLPIGLGRIGMGMCAGHDVAVLALGRPLEPGDVQCRLIQDAETLPTVEELGPAELQQLPVVVPEDAPGVVWRTAPRWPNERAGVSHPRPASS